MNEEQLRRLLEVLEDRKLITGYDSQYIQEKISHSEWTRFCRSCDWMVFQESGDE